MVRFIFMLTGKQINIQNLIVKVFSATHMLFLFKLWKIWYFCGSVYCTLMYKCVHMYIVYSSHGYMYMYTYKCTCMSVICNIQFSKIQLMYAIIWKTKKYHTVGTFWFSKSNRKIIETGKIGTPKLAPNTQIHVMSDHFQRSL